VSAPDRRSGALPRVGFILEQTLGHVTHAANLRSLVPADRRIDAEFVPVDYPRSGAAATLPGFRNWTVQAGLRARRGIAALRRQGPLEALFVHTQVPAILLPDVMRRIPTVVSLDATPIQYDQLGAHYGHDRGGRRAEDVKWRLNRDCFRRAAHIVTWAEWTKSGLVEDYGIAAERITVIPPGVDVGRWTRRDQRQQPSADATEAPLRVLFVGGDFARKGGEVLLDAVHTVRESGVGIEVDVVTRDEVPAQAGVSVHRGLSPNSDRLIELYERADVFCLPTLGDCLPMVLSEAGAMGLALVSTDVGAIGEIVRDGHTGLLVPAADAAALASALSRMATDARLRRLLGDGARALVADQYDAAKNSARLVDTILATL
jgi:glycosyltransferase involved in cell wall biosynthesis